RHRLADRHALPRRYYQPVTEHALRMRQAHRAAHELHIEAMDRQAFAAKAAVPAGLARIDGNQLADRQTRYSRAQCLHITRRFVPWNDRLAYPHRPKATILVVMQIGAADAAG